MQEWEDEEPKHDARPGLQSGQGEGRDPSPWGFSRRQLYHLGTTEGKRCLACHAEFPGQASRSLRAPPRAILQEPLENRAVTHPDPPDAILSCRMRFFFARGGPSSPRGPGDRG